MLHANCPKCAAPSAGQQVCPACGLIFAKYVPKPPATPRGAKVAEPPSLGVVIVSNLLPPVGVLLLGWNAASALFMVWLDTTLISLQLGVLAWVYAKPKFEPPAGTPRGPWMAGVYLGMAFFAPVFFAPPIVLGAHLGDLLIHQFPEGPLAAAFASTGIFVAIAINLGTRGWQVLVRKLEIERSAAAAASFAAQGVDQFCQLIYRMGIMIGVAAFASLFGRYGLALFFFAVSAFLTYADMHENWMRHFAGKVREWGEARRAKNKGRV